MIFKLILFSITLFFLLLIGFSSSKPFVVTQTKLSLESSESIFVVNHGWHSSLVVKTVFFKNITPSLEDRFKNKKFLEIGWGDKGFYQSKNINVWLVLKALFWPTESVMHVVGFSTSPKKYFKNSEITSITMNKESIALLIDFMRRSFLQNELKKKKFMPLSKGIYGDSQFYKAVGDYYFLNTCNHWTAKALKSAGLPISPRFKLTSDSIMAVIKNELISH